MPDGLEVAACRRLITSSFDQENVRTMAAVKEYAEAHRGDAAAG